MQEIEQEKIISPRPLPASHRPRSKPYVSKLIKDAEIYTNHRLSPSRHRHSIIAKKLHRSGSHGYVTTRCNFQQSKSRNCGSITASTLTRSKTRKSFDYRPLGRLDNIAAELNRQDTSAQEATSQQGLLPTIKSSNSRCLSGARRSRSRQEGPGTRGARNRGCSPGSRMLENRGCSEQRVPPFASIVLARALSRPYR